MKPAETSGPPDDRPRSSKCGVAMIVLLQATLVYSSSGLSSFLAVYLNEVLLYTESAASFITNISYAFSLSCGILGGWLADKRFGKLWTVQIGLILLFVSNLMLWVAAASMGRIATRNDLALVFVGLALDAFAGGICSPAVSAFLSDQFGEVDVTEADRIARSSFYRGYYIALNCGALVGSASLPVVAAKHTYTVAYLLLTIMAAFSALVLAAGAKHYVIVPVWANPAHAPSLDEDSGSSGNGMGNGHSGSGNGSSGRGHMHHDSHMAAAQLQRELFFQQQNELQRKRDAADFWQIVWFLLPASAVFWTLFYCLISLFTFTAEHMDRRVGSFEIPPGFMTCLNPLFDILLIPVFQFVIYPFFGVKRHYRERLIVGMLFAVASLCCAGTVEVLVDSHSRRVLSEDGLHITSTSSISVFWQVPQYVLMSIAEILVSVAGLEFAFDQSPASKTGQVMAVGSVAQALGNVFVALLTVANAFTRRVEYFVLAAAMFVTMLLFAWFSRRYVYRDRSKLDRLHDSAT